MNKYLQISNGLLMIIFAFSFFIVISSVIELTTANKVNNFIKSSGDNAQIASDEKVQFAHAYFDEQNKQSQKALEQLTQVLASDDIELKAFAYYNRGNIHLRQARSMKADDRKRLSLVELAKQDYRSALFFRPGMWNARFNLELALRMVPETDNGNNQADKKIIEQEKSVETVDFRADLP